MSMQLDKSPDSYLDRQTALEALVAALKGGCLTLFIGAGVSKSATKFPNWVSLVERCCRKKGIKFSKASQGSNTYLRRRIERVQEVCTASEYITLVSEELYRGVKYDIGMMTTDLLVSLGALVMNSVRGGAKDVVNYNFDDLLAWYLSYHGFRVEVASEYPNMSRKSDVRIYHPHGFLPHTKEFKSLETDKVVFSERDFQEAISTSTPWNELQRNLLGCNAGLFIGLSGNDPHIDSLCETVYNRVVKRGRIIGFIIVTDTKANRDNEKHNLARGIANIYIKNHQALPDLLLEICRMAAKSI